MRQAKAPAKGAVYERQALEYLTARGLTLVARNIRGRYGEIDLIMRDGDCLVFVEVRARNNQSRGGAIASLTPAKRHRLWKTAAGYLQQHPNSGPVRFDLIAMSSGAINWLTNILQQETLDAT